MLIDKTKGMVEVFAAFNTQASHPFPYPEDNTTIFEEWYYQNYHPADMRERVYLPIFWTGYYVRANYGKDAAAIQHLQGYINILDKTKKYYTIVQYDDGILNDLTGLDIRVFSMSGSPMDYPLPLICMPHKYRFDVIKKNIFMSFVGRATHPIREAILKYYGGQPDCYVTDRHHNMRDYCLSLAKSVFVLCPRGYGPTSFRIMEAIQYGAIPVYISDKLIFGHHHKFAGVGIMPIGEFIPEGIMDILKSNQHRIEKLSMQLPSTFEKYFTYEGTKLKMLENLIHEDFGNHRAAFN